MGLVLLLLLALAPLVIVLNAEVNVVFITSQEGLWMTLGTKTGFHITKLIQQPFS